jgi:hypothetical protein
MASEGFTLGLTAVPRARRRNVTVPVRSSRESVHSVVSSSGACQPERWRKCYVGTPRPPTRRTATASTAAVLAGTVLGWRPSDRTSCLVHPPPKHCIPPCSPRQSASLLHSFSLLSRTATGSLSATHVFSQPPAFTSVPQRTSRQPEEEASRLSLAIPQGPARIGRIPLRLSGCCSVRRCK